VTDERLGATCHIDGARDLGFGDKTGSMTPASAPT